MNWWYNPWCFVLANRLNVSRNWLLKPQSWREECRVMLVLLISIDLVFFVRNVYCQHGFESNGKRRWNVTSQTLTPTTRRMTPTMTTPTYGRGGRKGSVVACTLSRQHESNKAVAVSRQPASAVCWNGIKPPQRSERRTLSCESRKTDLYYCHPRTLFWVSLCKVGQEKKKETPLICRRHLDFKQIPSTQVCTFYTAIKWKVRPARNKHALTLALCCSHYFEVAVHIYC